MSHEPPRRPLQRPWGAGGGIAVAVQEEKLTQGASRVPGLGMDLCPLPLKRRIAAVADGHQQAAIGKPEQAGAEVLGAFFSLGYRIQHFLLRQGPVIEAGPGQTGAIGFLTAC